MSQDLVYLNGRLLPGEEATVSAFDYGLLYGVAVYDTMRAYSGRVFRLEQHLARLEYGLEKLGIAMPGIGALKDAVGSVMEANGLREARIRVTVTAGAGRHGPRGVPETEPAVLVTGSPLAAVSEEAYEAGHSAIISSVRRNSQSAVVQHKSTNGLESLLAYREAREKGAEQAIMLNEKRCFTECSWANIFFVAYKRLMTPSLDCGLLQGITRDAVIDIALRLGIGVNERWINAEEVWDAEEVFVTSSPLGVMPVTSINGRQIRGSVPGKITRSLTLAYADMVKEELGL